MSRVPGWLRRPWREPPLPVRVPPPPLAIPDWRAPWLLSAAVRLAEELVPGEELVDLTLTVRARDGVYVGLVMPLGGHWPERAVLACDENGELRAVDVPDTVAGLEDE